MSHTNKFNLKQIFELAFEYQNKKKFESAKILYEKIRAEAFPTLELVMNIRTGPTSLMSVAVYPSKESADSNLTARGKFQEKLDSSLKDSFFHEGEVTYFFQSKVRH